jgi:hypothetical protein
MAPILRNIKFRSRWYIAEECEDKEKRLYYLVTGHICPVGEVGEFGKYVEPTPPG